MKLTQPLAKSKLVLQVAGWLISFSLDLYVRFLQFASQAATQVRAEFEEKRERTEKGPAYPPAA